VLSFAAMADISLFIKFFGLAFSALLPVVNPFGSALIFLGIVGELPGSAFRSLAWKIAISTTIFLVVIEVVGTALLAFFGISLGVVQVAGGLVLAAMGWSLLNEQQASPKSDAADVAATKLSTLAQQTFYPLTFPVTAGPGCIVVTLTLSAHASAKSVLPNLMGHLGIVVAIIVQSALVYFCYAYAPKITERVSAQTAHGILRVIAFVLLCIGVQITWNGVESLLKTVVKA
jgi:multiple antibiotic resistance protein